MDDQYYDVIVIGTGADGGTFAHRLDPSDKRVLMLERETTCRASATTDELTEARVAHHLDVLLEAVATRSWQEAHSDHRARASPSGSSPAIRATANMVSDNGASESPSSRALYSEHQLQIGGGGHGRAQSVGASGQRSTVVRR